MAEEEDVSAEDEVEAGEDGEDGASRKKFSKRSLLLFVVAPLVLLIALGAGAWVSGLADPLLAMFLGAPPGGEHGEAHKEEVVEAGPATYYDLPQMLVNLNNTGRKSNFLKIVVSLEVSGEGASTALDEALPRIVDNFQVYLRELRVEDLRGSAGVYRLREELLFRVNAAVADVKVTDVLFKEMLVQ